MDDDSITGLLFLIFVTTWHFWACLLLGLLLFVLA